MGSDGGMGGSGLMVGLVDMEDCDMNMVTLDGLSKGYSHLNSMKRQGHKGARHASNASSAAVGTNHLLQQSKNKTGTLGRDSSYHIDV